MQLSYCSHCIWWDVVNVSRHISNGNEDVICSMNIHIVRSFTKCEPPDRIKNIQNITIDPLKFSQKPPIMYIETIKSRRFYANGQIYQPISNGLGGRAVDCIGPRKSSH